MLISKINYKNDVILGNLKLNFSSDRREIYKTIVLAGENGTGKTRIMDTLFGFLNLGPITPFDSIEYVVNDNESYKVFYDENIEHSQGFHKRTNLNNPEDVQDIRQSNSVNRHLVEQDIADIRHYGVAYLSARSGFNTSRISSTTTQQLDTQKRIDDKREDYTKVKQLIINLYSQDNAKLSESVYDPNNDNLNIADLRQRHDAEYSKLRRFKRAFNKFFDNKLVFDTVDFENASEINVYFRKNNKKIKIDDLSSGEKQIVFRGAKLLSDVSLIGKGLIMIDEPELNLHPLWQNKILEYYQDLFKSTNGEQPQMIVATHSEYIVGQALGHRNDTLVIVLKNDEEGLKTDTASTKSDQFVLSELSAAEVNYLAFNLPTIDYHIGLYGRLQSVLNTTSIITTDRKIKEYIERKYQGVDKERLLRTWQYNETTYETLSTYIRNSIDHPNNIENQESGNYGEQDLKKSIDLLRNILHDIDVGNFS